MDVSEYYKKFSYCASGPWYDGVYADRAACRSSARPFELLHSEKPDECWLFIHGYRGYPGELVRPAVDLYEAGFDIYVPRLPGHGTSGADFIRSHSRDWVKLAENALHDLEGKYKTVHILSHSMGTAIAALIGSGDKQVGKIVYACPSFENLAMPFFVRLVLAVLSVFTPKVHCKWHASTKYHMHYENAPCDDEYYGKEYWQFYFTRQLLEYYRLAKRGLASLKAHPHENLVIYPKRDEIISAPSVALYKKAVGSAANVAEIENGTHFIFYDCDEEAENSAVKAIVDFALK